MVGLSAELGLALPAGWLPTAEWLRSEPVDFPAVLAELAAVAGERPGVAAILAGAFLLQ